LDYKNKQKSRHKETIFEHQMEITPTTQSDQISFGSMEEWIEKDNAVRVIDAFAEHIDLKELGFVIAGQKTEGRPSYNAKMFLKLCFYGYLNGLRSSRKLAKECVRNIEVRWLLCKLLKLPQLL